MDAFIIIILILMILFWYRKFSKGVYGVAMIDIFLRIIAFISVNIGKNQLSNFLASYFPNNLLEVIDKYADGILYDVLAWLYVGIMICFLFYTARIFIKKR